MSVGPLLRTRGPLSLSCFSLALLQPTRIPQATQPDQLDNRPRHTACLCSRRSEVQASTTLSTEAVPCRSSYTVLCRHSSCSACRAPLQRQRRPLETRCTMPPLWPCSKP